MLHTQFMEVFGLAKYAFAIGVLGFVIVAASNAFQVRRQMIRLRRRGLSFAPHNPVVGSLIAMKDVLADLPADMNPQYIPISVRRKYPEVGNLYYLDNWPFVEPMLVAASPTAAWQVTQEHSLPKFPALRHFMKPIAGHSDLTTMEGDVWKKWRGIFNPGFSGAHLISLAPEIVKQGLIFCEILEEHAAADKLFQLKQHTDNFTMDVVGKLVLNAEFGSQRKRNPMVTALRSQSTWLSIGKELNLWQRWHPIRPFVHWYNSRVMNAYLKAEFDSRFAEYKGDSSFAGGRSIIDRSIQTYLSETSSTLAMDDTFKMFVIDQMKLFLFSGHDTTSAVTCYVFYVLSTHPTVLARVRAEHDEILGLDLGSAASLISNEPHILNKLPYTIAVIKETLRLYPVASTLRQGQPGFSIIDEDGSAYPTEGCLVWPNPHALHRSPEYWPRAEEFVPERWLVPAGHELHPVKGAWRPFEFGPRNCIGQELALLELRVIVALVARQFDLRVVYGEWDRLHPRRGPKTVGGERAYTLITSGPSDGLPCRVEMRRSKTQ